MGTTVTGSTKVERSGDDLIGTVAVDRTEGVLMLFRYTETMGHSRIEITLNVYGHLLKDNEDAKKETAEALATEILGNPCGKSVASTL